MSDYSRRDLRLQCNIKVFYDEKNGETKNISANGTFIKKDTQSQLHPIGSDIALSLDFPNERDFIEVKGMVVHHGNDDGMGIWFKKIDERKKEFIRKFITHPR